MRVLVFLAEKILSGSGNKNDIFEMIESNGFGSIDSHIVLKIIYFILKENLEDAMPMAKISRFIKAISLSKNNLHNPTGISFFWRFLAREGSISIALSQIFCPFSFCPIF